MKLFFRILILSVIFWKNTSAQDSILVSQYKPESFAIGFNGNIFLVSGSNLYELDSKGNFLFSYSEKTYGNISSMDITNPFKFLVFYKETGTISFLDNHLKELQSPISLPKQGLINTELACMGSDNSFWIYYNDTRQLIKFDRQLNAISSTTDLSILCPTNYSPKSVIERGDKLFLEVSGFGVLIFYTTGNYLQTLHFPNIFSFMPITEKALFYKDSLSIPTMMDYTVNQINLMQATPMYSTRNQSVYYNNKIYTLTNKYIMISTLLDVKSLNKQ